MAYNEPAPKDFTWPNGAKLALSLVVNVEEGAEKSVLEGDSRSEVVDELGAGAPKGFHGYGNASNYQYGINRGAPRILRLLDAAKVAVTWTICAQALEKAPWLGEAIAARGDEPCSHGYKWAFTIFMDETDEMEFIQKATRSIEKTCGRRPVGYLSRYLHSANTRRLLIEDNYLYHMDDYSDDFPFWDYVDGPDGGKTPIVILPYAIDSNDMKFWVAPSYTPDMWLDYAKRTFDTLLAEANRDGARMMSFGLHLRIIGRPGRIGAFEEFLDYVCDRDDVWIATREDIARHFAAQIPAAG